jgi:NOL1/NOP2/sun family putative RNA methylase
MGLPSSFITSLQGLKGFDETSFINVHNNPEQITSVRVNPNKNPNDVLLFAGNEKINWCRNGYYLKERPSFTLDPLFHAGAYYVQEASSMFLEEVLRQTVDLSKSSRVLDLCAAPGGKSTLTQSVISGDSLLVANEVIKTRVNILAENISKWGAANVIVTNNDPRDFQRLPGFFDVVVVDAPCSGSGLFRKDADAISEWSEQNVQLCSQRQQRILADVWPALKENGILIYSTCSYSQEEDEMIADWLMEGFRVEGLRLKVEEEWGIVETVSSKHNAYGYRFYPGKVKGEGFFIAAFRKNAGSGIGDHKQKNRLEKLPSKEVDIVKPYLKSPGDFFFIKQKDEVIAIPKQFEENLAALQNSLYIRKAGVKTGNIIRNELLPHHELALSTIINASLPSAGLDEATALQYLRKHDISMNGVPKGWLLVKYGGLLLGWVKVLPGRVNNYYPKEWRIVNK